tara:strand:- start:26 stop:166 length:141 start_codon:yes stop_codon:yes gene_type:complete
MKYLTIELSFLDKNLKTKTGDSTTPLKGDNGIRFEPIKETAGDERL